MMERVAKIVSGKKPLTIFTKQNGLIKQSKNAKRM